MQSVVMNDEFDPTAGGGFGDLGHGGLEGFIWTDAREFAKAVTSGYGTDVAQFQGGRAVQLQSIEHTLLATIQKEKHLKAFNSLSKTDATATVDEYVQQTTVGGFLGGAYNDEVGVIQEDQADYLRRTLNIKYLMTMRRVSVVQQSTKGVVDVITNQTRSAILQLLSDAEWGIFYGDSAMSSVEFDGVETTVRAQAPADHIIDLRGGSITPVAAEFIRAASLVSSYENVGKLDNAYMSNLVAQDIDQKLDGQFRIVLKNDAQTVKAGAPVLGVVTRWGNINIHDDIFIQEGQMPWNVRSARLAALAAARLVNEPATVVAVAAANAASLFATAHAGLYTWGAEGGNKDGRSLVVTQSATINVAAGDGVTVTITAQAGSNETYYMLYRSRRNGTANDNDLREMVRIAKHVSGTTVYVDLNQNVPGSSKIYCFTQEEEAITIRRLLPMTKFRLYPSNTPVIPWAHLLFLALRVGKPNQHVIITNVVPAGQAWQPF